MLAPVKVKGQSSGIYVLLNQWSFEFISHLLVTTSVAMEMSAESPAGNSPTSSTNELFLLAGDRLEGVKDVGPDFAVGDDTLDKLSELTVEADTIDKGIEGPRLTTLTF